MKLASIAEVQPIIERSSIHNHNTPFRGLGGFSMTAEDWYQKGNAYRKQSDWQHALDCYMEAIALDPDSPAVVAKKMLEDILNFYHKDAYNP